MSACDEFFAALLEDSPLSAEHRTHAVACEHCRALIGEHALRDTAPPPAPVKLGGVFREELRAQAMAEIAVRPRVMRWYVPAVGLVALNVAVLGLAFAKLGFDNVSLSSASAWRMAVTAGVLFACLTLGVLAAVMPRGTRLRRGMTLVSALVPAAVLLGADGQRVCNSIAQALPCTAVELGLSVVPLAAAAWVLTRSAFKLERSFLAAMGGATVGLLVLHVHCLDGSPRHLVLYHLIPGAAVTALAMAVRWRAPSRSFVP